MLKTQSSAATSEQQHLLKTATKKSSFRSILCNVGVHLDFASNAAFSASNSLCSLNMAQKSTFIRLRQSVTCVEIMQMANWRDRLRRD
jgi:hypothetical protein